MFLHPCEGEAVCKLTNEKVTCTVQHPCIASIFTELSLLPVSVQSPPDACAVMQVPYFNAPMFLQNKTQIGKIEEIFGAINDGVCPVACALSPFEMCTELCCHAPVLACTTH